MSDEFMKKHYEKIQKRKDFSKSRIRVDVYDYRTSSSNIIVLDDISFNKKEKIMKLINKIQEKER